MPETFGAGTAGAGYDERSTPSTLTPQVIASSSVGSSPVAVANQLFVLTALDLVTYGGGVGGVFFVWQGNPGNVFCGFNVGNAADAFSWRGWLPVASSLIGWNNNSDSQAVLTLNGLNFLPPE